MRTTLPIDDDLLLELESRAAQEGISLTRLVDRVLRAGLLSEQQRKRARRRHRERTYSMGVPRVDFTKALSVASSLEDNGIAHSSGLRQEDPESRKHATE